MTLTSSATLGTFAIRIPCGTRLRVNEISALLTGFLVELPLKIRSSDFVPRSDLELCSPITHRMASETLLFPHPFGPTIAVNPEVKSICVPSTNDLNPSNSRLFNSMGTRIFNGFKGF